MEIMDVSVAPGMFYTEKHLDVKCQNELAMHTLVDQLKQYYIYWAS